MLWILGQSKCLNKLLIIITIIVKLTRLKHLEIQKIEVKSGYHRPCICSSEKCVSIITILRTTQENKILRCPSSLFSLKTSFLYASHSRKLPVLACFLNPPAKLNGYLHHHRLFFFFYIS